MQDKLLECRALWDYAPVAQLDRVPGFEPGCRGFESLRAHQKILSFNNLPNYSKPYFLSKYCHVPILYQTHALRHFEVADYLDAHNVALFRKKTNRQASAIHIMKFHFVSRNYHCLDSQLFLEGALTRDQCTCLAGITLPD